MGRMREEDAVYQLWRRARTKLIYVERGAGVFSPRRSTGAFWFLMNVSKSSQTQSAEVFFKRQRSKELIINFSPSPFPDFFFFFFFFLLLPSSFFFLLQKEKTEIV